MRSPVRLVLIHGSWCINKNASGWFETNEKVIFPLFRVFWFDIDYEVKKQGNEQGKEKDGRKRDREREHWRLRPLVECCSRTMSVEGCLWRDVCSLECGRRRREAAGRDTEKANCCHRGTIGIKRRESNRPPFDMSNLPTTLLLLESPLHRDLSKSP